MPARLALLFLLLASDAAATVVLDFEDAAPGERVDDRYRGVTFTGQGNGGPFPVIADSSCVGVPNQVLSLRPVEDCPEASEFWGFFDIRFDEAQPRVAITAIADGSSAVVYLKAYDDQGFLDQKLGQVGEEWDGVPQVIEITRDPGDRWITRVEAGALRSGGRAGFDNLEFEVVPVAVESSSWSAVKARF